MHIQYTCQLSLFSIPNASSRESLNPNQKNNSRLLQPRTNHLENFHIRSCGVIESGGVNEHQILVVDIVFHNGASDYARIRGEPVTSPLARLLGKDVNKLI